MYQESGTLSGGEKTKLALAMLMVGRNNLLLLDEPTNNLDPPSRQSVADALTGWKGSIIFVSHDTEFVEQLAADQGAADARRPGRLLQPGLARARRPRVTRADLAQRTGLPCGACASESWGTPSTSGTIDQVVDEARQAVDDGFATFWSSQIFGHDALTMLAIVGREVPGIELGTAVVPTYPRHPMMLAQQALTVQSAITPPATGRAWRSASGCRTRSSSRSMWGLSFDKPVRHLREYLSVMMPLLEGEPVDVRRRERTACRAALTISGIPRPSVLVAALGTQMLRVTGALADGTSTWCVGPKTLQRPHRAHAAPGRGRRRPARAAGRRCAARCASPTTSTRRARVPSRCSRSTTRCRATRR